ncbi:hypothetical protein Emed_007028 [Eimeria media]
MQQNTPAAGAAAAAQAAVAAAAAAVAAADSAGTACQSGKGWGRVLQEQQPHHLHTCSHRSQAIPLPASMAAYGCYSESDGGLSRGPTSSAASLFSGLAPGKQAALMQLLDDLKDELHATADVEPGAWTRAETCGLESAPECPGTQERSSAGVSSSAYRSLTSVSTLQAGAVTLMSLELSLEETPTQEDAASLFASSAILRTSLWDSGSCTSSSSNRLSNTCSGCSSPAAAAACQVLQASAEAEAPAVPAEAAAAAAAAALAAAATAAPEQFDSLCIPDEATQIPWPLAFPKRHPRWGPARGPAAAAVLDAPFIRGPADAALKQRMDACSLLEQAGAAIKMVAAPAAAAERASTAVLAAPAATAAKQQRRESWTCVRIAYRPRELYVFYSHLPTAAMKLQRRHQGHLLLQGQLLLLLKSCSSDGGSETESKYVAFTATQEGGRDTGARHVVVEPLVERANCVGSRFRSFC